MAKKTGVHIREPVGGPKAVMQALDRMASNEVLVGFPEASTDRKPEDSEEEPIQDLTNAALGYIHDNGAPEVNIPARPFMVPGITAARSKIIKIAKHMGQAALTADNPQEAIDQGLHMMGLTAQASIRSVINDGIDPPLADRTLKARARKGSKGAEQELANRAKGLPPGKELAKPLVETGQLRNAVNYVIRNRKRRSK